MAKSPVIVSINARGYGVDLLSSVDADGRIVLTVEQVRAALAALEQRR